MAAKRNFICLFILLILLVGCDKKVLNPPTTQQQVKELAVTDVSSYFPVEQGLTWEYEGNGNEYAAFTRKALYRENNLVEMSDNNGGTVMGMTFKVSPASVEKIFSIPEFYDERNILKEKPNLQEVILKAPLKVGAAWKNDNSKREIVSIDEKIDTPSGIYDHVVKIKITSLDEKAEPSENYEYYAKGVGLVRREFISGQTKVTSKLKSFKKTSARPKSKKGFITLEGTDQEFNLNLLEGSTYPFYTYVPADMIVERVSSGEGNTFDIMTDFGGKKREDVYLSIFFYPAGTSAEQAVKFANSVVLNNEWLKVGRYPNAKTEKYYNWSQGEWHFTKGVNNVTYVGSMAVGMHNKQAFYILTYYPEEFAEGFIPRVHKILDEFVWTDTGEKLGK